MSFGGGSSGGGQQQVQAQGVTPYAPAQPALNQINLSRSSKSPLIEEVTERLLQSNRIQRKH